MNGRSHFGLPVEQMNLIINGGYLMPFAITWPSRIEGRLLRSGLLVGSTILGPFLQARCHGPTGKEASIRPSCRRCS